MSKVTLHCQGHEGWLADFLSVSGARWIKYVNWFPVMGASLIGRVWVPEADQDLMIAAGATGADAFFSRVYPEMQKARHVALWEGPNEPSIWKASVLSGLGSFYRRLIELYHANGFKILAGSINTGWPYLPADDGGAQSRAVGQAIQGADAVGFHEYDPRDLRAGNGYTTLRYRKTVSYWKSLGLSVPPVFITELGLDAPGGPCFGHWGWRGILGGNLAAYVEQLRWYEARIQEDGYVQGATIFSVVTNWTDFALDQGQAMELARALGDGGPAPPVPPPPPPEPGEPMNLKIYDGQGTERAEAWLRQNYGNVQAAAEAGAEYATCELRESLNGSSALVVSLRGDGGEPQQGRTVTFGWPDGEVQGTTNEAGNIGFGMGGGAYYPLGGTGPHYVQAGGVTVSGLGMKWGTNHDHLNVTLWAGEPTPPPPPPETRAVGVDVSQYQGDLSWDAAQAAGASFALLRLGDGVTKDAKFERNWAESGSRGFLRGVYHLVRPDVDYQAAFVEEALAGREPELGVYADLERAGLDSARCERFLTYTDQKLGRTVHVYSRKSFLDPMGAIPWAAGRRLWVASPGTSVPAMPNAWTSWEFWQYGQGTIGGRTVDLDRFDGTEAELRAKYGGPEPPPVAPVALFTVACDGLTCQFDASTSYDPDGTIAGYAWDFGDGSTGSGMRTAKAYARAGTYAVTLTVTDDGGNRGAQTRDVTVSDEGPPEPPPDFETAVLEKLDIIITLLESV